MSAPGPSDELAESQLQSSLLCLDSPEGTASVHRVSAKVRAALTTVCWAELLCVQVQSACQLPGSRHEAK